MGMQTKLLVIAAALLVNSLAEAVPIYQHILIVVEEDKDYAEIVGNTTEAPYINNTLIAGGALLTDYNGLAHDSQPNYLAMYGGDTFGATNRPINVPDPSLYTMLQGIGHTFKAFRDVSGLNLRPGNPWESFPEGTSVEQNFTGTFYQSGFAKLPSVSFVIPSLDHNMHDGTIGEGDDWLSTNLDAYAKWAKTHGSLLVVVFDEAESTQNNHTLCILYGDFIVPGQYATTYNHYSLLRTILNGSGITGALRNSNTMPVFSGMFE